MFKDGRGNGEGPFRGCLKIGKVVQKSPYFPLAGVAENSITVVAYADSRFAFEPTALRGVVVGGTFFRRPVDSPGIAKAAGHVHGLAATVFREVRVSPQGRCPQLPFLQVDDVPSHAVPPSRVAVDRKLRSRAPDRRARPFNGAPFSGGYQSHVGALCFPFIFRASCQFITKYI